MIDTSHIRLGSTVTVSFDVSRRDTGTERRAPDVRSGVLVARRNEDDGSQRLVVETLNVYDDGGTHRSESVHFSTGDDVKIEVVASPAAGSMLVVYNMGLWNQRVRHVAPSRLAALEWLEEHRPDWLEHGDIGVVPAHDDEPEWTRPLEIGLVPVRRSESFRDLPEGVTGIPVGDRHPGAFGFRRRKHVHEGVDLYCTEGATVHAMEAGEVVAVIPFTGTIAEPPSPWWNDTWAVLVEGVSGVVVYGEVDGISTKVGDRIETGRPIGRVRRVMTKDNGRPLDMLHVELHRHGTRDAYEWTLEGERPASLLDPTEMLLSIHFAEARTRPVPASTIRVRRIA